MRVKQTARKITTDDQTDSNSVHTNHESDSNHNENTNHTSDNDVEIVVECRRDVEGNQFLLDGTLVIEPAEVADNINDADPKPNSSAVVEIDFAQFVKQIQFPISDKPNGPNTTFQPIAKKPQVLAPFSIPQISVKCTACNAKFNPFFQGSLHKHPDLAVILCKACIENQNDKYFVIDEEDNKETLCRWCVEGGSLICCDFCPKSYCKTCIKRNLGRTVLSEILNQDDSVQWKCFVCDPTPIKILQESYDRLINEIEKFNDSRNKSQIKANKKPIPRVDSAPKKRNPIKPLSNNSPPAQTAIPTARIFTNALLKMMNQPGGNANANTINLLNNMEGFGTNWYSRNINLDNILADIDKVDSRSLLNAINSTKKCIEAFYSDIRNLENEISKAGSSLDITSTVSMFKSVFRHHIFNRFCQIQTRLEEDRKTTFVPQTINGYMQHKQAHINNNNNNSPGPNLMINSVVSKATINTNKRPSDSFMPQVLAKKIRQIPNGNDRKSLPVMYSIDLTDDGDKIDSKGPLKKENGVTPLMEKVSEEFQRASKEVVDLCNDDDSSSMVSYPVVRMDYNNQLFNENKS